MSTNRAIAWNTGVQFLGKILSTIIGVAIVALMTRYLGTERFGMYSTANAYFQVFAVILDFGLSITLIQMLGERREDKTFEDRAASATFTLRLVTAAILLTIAPFIALLFDYPPELKWAMFAIWGSFFSATLTQIVVGIHQRHLKMHIVAIAEVAGRLTLLIGVIIAQWLHWGLIPIVLIVSLGGFINFGITAIVANRYASLRWNWDPEFWRLLASRSWPIGVSIFFALVYYKADALLLSFWRPFTEVGIYSAAYRVLDIFTTLPFMYMGVVLPILASTYATKDMTRFNTLLRSSYTVMLMMILPVVTGAFVMGREVMSVISGEEFILSGDVLKILILACAAIFFGTVSGHAIVALQLQKKMLGVYCATAIGCLIAYAVLIPIYGMWAAAWLTVVSEVAVAAGATYFTFRSTQLHLDLDAILKTAASAVIMAFVILPLKDLWLPIPLAIGAIVYAILLFATGVVSKRILTEVFRLS